MRLALARLALKAGFDPGQPRVPRGTHGGGQWAGGDGAGSGSLVDNGPSSKRRGTTEVDHRKFVASNRQQAERVAEALGHGADADAILAFSSVETDWGTAYAVTDANNFLGFTTAKTGLIRGRRGLTQRLASKTCPEY